MLVYKLIIYVISAGVYNLLEPSAYEEIQQRLYCATHTVERQCRALSSKAAMPHALNTAAMPRNVERSGSAARKAAMPHAARTKRHYKIETQEIR